MTHNIEDSGQWSSYIVECYSEVFQSKIIERNHTNKNDWQWTHLETV